MKLRALVLMAVVAFATLAASFASEAQPPGKVPRIGVFGSEASMTIDSLEAFRQGLRDFGYVDGRNIVIERAKSSADPSRRAAELVRLKVDVILALNTATTPQELAGAFGAAAKARADALFVLSDTMFFRERRQIAALAERHRLPTMYHWRAYVDAGGLMSYGSNLAASHRRAAYFVDSILKGAKPGDLPVEQPTKFELVINLKAAKALGLTIPQTLLVRADEVIP